MAVGFSISRKIQCVKRTHAKAAETLQQEHVDFDIVYLSKK